MVVRVFLDLMMNFAQPNSYVKIKKIKILIC